jgi:hypothetical protein
MAKVIRLEHGGGAVVEDKELTVEQAQSLAQRLAAVGEPAGCCWCVGLWDEEEEEVVDQSLGSPLSTVWRYKEGRAAKKPK